MHNVLIFLADIAIRPPSSPASSSASGVFGVFGLLLMLLSWTIGIALALAIYWAPTIVAIFKKHPHLVGIIVINFFFGWTLIGWIASFIWAFIIPQPPQIIVQQVPVAPGMLPPPVAAPIPEPPKTTKLD